MQADSGVAVLVVVVGEEGAESRAHHASQPAPPRNPDDLYRLTRTTGIVIQPEIKARANNLVSRHQSLPPD